MKNITPIIISVALTLLLHSPLQAQETKIGDQFIIGTPIHHSYTHIRFPQKNFIIKRGGIADMKQVSGLAVIVEDISYDRNGNTLLRLIRKDHGKFFRSYTHVTAVMEKAIKNGELKRI
ncbi:MAG: hypothetical protein OER83_00130 [Flavobacteriaceae bacterium]|nr:hypothetical protein [Flavobacteriaceae bacterium]MDH3795255.1 hypothetical protein [Flavobacteriaceae bacterium]